VTNAQRRRVLWVAAPVVGADSIAVAQRVQAWVLDSANERDAAAVLAELPHPARLMYRWAIRPRYEAEHRWQTNLSTTKRRSNP
jgi:hypothetical protein